MTRRNFLSGGVPPAPNRASAQGFTAAQYLQFEPQTQTKIDESYFEGTPLNTIYPKTQNLYSIGGVDMFPPPHNIGRYALNEYSVAKQKKEIDTNTRKYVPGFSVSYPYSGTGDPNFHKDVWSLQTIVFWITDGAAFESDFPKMKGLVTRNKHNPSDLTPLNLQPDGRVTEDLKTVFPKKNLPSGETAPRGPDGIYGIQTDSILAEYVRTGKAFGKTIPSNTIRLFDRLVQGVSSNGINEAKRLKALGMTTPAKSAKKIPTAAKSGAAQVSAGEPLTKINRETGERPVFIAPSAPSSYFPQSEPAPGAVGPVGPVGPQGAPGGGGGAGGAGGPGGAGGVADSAAGAAEEDVDTKGEEEEDNTLLYVGAGLAVCAILAAGVMMYNSDKKKKMPPRGRAGVGGQSANKMLGSDRSGRPQAPSANRLPARRNPHCNCY